MKKLLSSLLIIGLLLSSVNVQAEETKDSYNLGSMKLEYVKDNYQYDTYKDGDDKFSYRDDTGDLVYTVDSWNNVSYSIDVKHSNTPAVRGNASLGWSVVNTYYTGKVWLYETERMLWFKSDSETTDYRDVAIDKLEVEAISLETGEKVNNPKMMLLEYKEIGSKGYFIFPKGYAYTVTLSNAIKSDGCMLQNTSNSWSRHYYLDLRYSFVVGDIEKFIKKIQFPESLEIIAEQHPYYEDYRTMSIITPYQGLINDENSLKFVTPYQTSTSKFSVAEPISWDNFVFEKFNLQYEYKSEKVAKGEFLNVTAVPTSMSNVSSVTSAAIGSVHIDELLTKRPTEFRAAAIDSFGYMYEVKYVLDTDAKTDFDKEEPTTTEEVTTETASTSTEATTTEQKSETTTEVAGGTEQKNENSTEVSTTESKAEETTKTEASTSTSKTEQKSTYNKKIKKPSIKSVKYTKSGKKVTVSMKKLDKKFKYQCQLSTSKKFKKVYKSKTFSKTSYTFKKMKKGTYYVRVRLIKDNEYGKWSSVKKVKVK